VSLDTQKPGKMPGRILHLNMRRTFPGDTFLESGGREAFSILGRTRFDCKNAAAGIEAPPEDFRRKFGALKSWFYYRLDL
jgi:hypothetical protein